jgi:hypothetical protein
MSIGAEVNGGLLHRPPDGNPQRALEDKSARSKVQESIGSNENEVKE